MDHCDVLIVGGGPAGTTCARALVAAGLDVMVIDKATFPRDKPCAGWITPPVVEILGLEIDEYRAGGRVCQPITAFRTSRIDSRPGRTSGRAIETDFEAPVSYGILRREFDHYLLERCGARVRMGTPFTSMRRTEEGQGDGAGHGAGNAAGNGHAVSNGGSNSGEWIVNETIRTPLVIGAGGHFCPVARQLTPIIVDDDREHVVAAQEIEVRMTPAQAAACAASGERPELYLCEDLKGYGWCFRKEDVLNIGLGRLDRHALSAHVKAFADWLVSEARVPADLVWRWKGHAYLLREESTRSLTADGVMLIGDAAGLAYSRSGEGIRPAIESAVLAAQAILTARGLYTRAELEPYREAIESRFGAGATSVAAGAGNGVGVVNGATSAGFIPERVSVALGRLLLRTRPFTRDVLLRRWFLHTQDPPLQASVKLNPDSHSNSTRPKEESMSAARPQPRG